MCSICWYFFHFGFIDILSGISHGIHKTCNTFTSKLFWCQLFTILPIGVVDSQSSLYLCQLLVLAALLLQLYLELSIALPTSFNHFLKMFFALVLVFSVLFFLQPHAQLAFLWQFTSLNWLQNHELNKNWHDIVLLIPISMALSQWNKEFRW